MVKNLTYHLCRLFALISNFEALLEQQKAHRRFPHFTLRKIAKDQALLHFGRQAIVVSSDLHATKSPATRMDLHSQSKSDVCFGWESREPKQSLLPCK